MENSLLFHIKTLRSSHQIYVNIHIYKKKNGICWLYLWNSHLCHWDSPQERGREKERVSAWVSLCGCVSWEIQPQCLQGEEVKTRGCIHTSLLRSAVNFTGELTWHEMRATHNKKKKKKKGKSNKQTKKSAEFCSPGPQSLLRKWREHAQVCKIFNVVIGCALCGISGHWQHILQSQKGTGLEREQQKCVNV